MQNRRLGAVYCSLFVTLYDIVEKKLRPHKQVGIHVNFKIAWTAQKSLSVNAIFKDGIDSIFHQFPSTVNSAFGIMAACMGTGLD